MPPCDCESSTRKAVERVVSILVLMDAALRHEMLYLSDPTTLVSILVLMDAALRPGRI